jgi:hypothetical protein
MMCLGILVVLTLVNLRGAQATGGIFLAPTYLFIACLVGMITFGVFKTVIAGGHPVPIVAPPQLKGTTEAISAWLVIRAFSSGCTAMTGVEAVSNGVIAFREPSDRYAQRTLTIIIAILAVMLLGIAYLAPAYGVTATPPGAEGYESVLSQLLGAITGKGAFYWVSTGAIVVVLSLSANTAFADFPRLARAIASNNFLPNGFTLRGRRLVYSQGVYALSFLTGLLLIIFAGVTDRLIPLYAVGAFLAFTLSQAGMVVHWKRTGGSNAGGNMLVNGIGAVATGITVAVVLVAKFTDGAWITVLLIPALILLMRGIKTHYNRVEQATRADGRANTENLCPPIVIIPIERWSIISERALRFAWTLSKDIRILHVECGEQTDSLCRTFAPQVAQPAQEAGLPVPELVLLKSPYRFVTRPIVDYASRIENENPDQQVSVLIPELVESHWFYYMLHNNRSQVLKALLLFGGNQRITVINIPWRLNN